MTRKPIVVSPKDYEPPLPIVGEQITVLASGDKTGNYEVFLQQGPEGSGPPPHSHPWDESFYVIKGEVTMGLGEATHTATPGTFVHIPAETVHWFRFGSGGAELVSMTSRLGASKMFTDFAREISPTHPDPEKLAEIGARHGLQVHLD